MRRAKQSGYIMPQRGWWVLSYRERVGVGGKIKTVQRAKRLAPVDSQHKTKASVRDLANRELNPLNRNSAEPMSVTKLGDFVDRVYLPFVKQQKRPSTHRGYSQMWSIYLKTRCESPGSEKLGLIKCNRGLTRLRESTQSRKQHGNMAKTSSVESSDTQPSRDTLMVQAL